MNTYFDIQQLFLHQKIDVPFNPFGGLDEEYLLEVLQPRLNLEQLASSLLNEPPKVVEFIGKKGRGKTTHLRALAQLLPEDKSIYIPQNQPINFPEELKIVLIDSIHFLSLKQRWKLWRNHEISIVTNDHISRILEYKLANRRYESHRFKGLSEAILTKTIQQRVATISNKTAEEIPLDTVQIKLLLKEYGDDFRGILNYLYDEFQMNMRN